MVTYCPLITSFKNNPESGITLPQAFGLKQDFQKIEGCLNIDIRCWKFIRGAIKDQT